MTTPYQRIRLATLLCERRKITKTQAYDIIEDCDFSNIAESAEILKIETDTLKKIMED